MPLPPLSQPQPISHVARCAVCNAWIQSVVGSTHTCPGGKPRGGGSKGGNSGGSGGKNDGKSGGNGGKNGGKNGGSGGKKPNAGGSK